MSPNICAAGLSGSDASVFSLDGAKAQTVVDEIKAAGGDAIAVGGDVGADDFPEKILKATIEYVSLFPFLVRISTL